MTALKHAVALTLSLAIAGLARGECVKTCFADLPCRTVELRDTFKLNQELCAGNLVIRPGTTIILTSPTADIFVERDMLVEGAARIVAEWLVPANNDVQAKPAPKPKGPSFERGPNTDGPGNARNGRSGGRGDDGTTGKDGADGLNGADLTLVVQRNLVISDKLSITIGGGNGQDGAPGGDGGPGGDGEQGGRSIPAQPFGCASGPGYGGNGNDGGDGGLGGAAGNGGNGGKLRIRVAKELVAQVKSAIGSKIIVDVSGGAPGSSGASGEPGGPGLFGWGGRGSTGCEGKIDERKGHSGIAGRKPAQRVPLTGRPSTSGSVDVLPLQGD